MLASFRRFHFSVVLICVFGVANEPLGCLRTPAGQANGAELVVDNLRGSDVQAKNDGIRTQSPYKTLQRAINNAIMGDSIRLVETGQPYRECVSINTNNALGTAYFPLIIEGSGVTLDGTRPLGVLDWSAMGADLFELNFRSPGYVKFLAASDQPTPENLGHVSELSQLKPFQYGRNTGSVFFKSRPGETPQGYGLRVSAEQTGLTLYDVGNLIIRNLNVVGYRLDGINCHDLVNNVRFENLVVTHNGRSGISVGGSSQVLVINSSAASNGESQVRTEGQSLLELSNVKIDDTLAQGIDRAGGRVVEVR